MLSSTLAGKFNRVWRVAAPELVVYQDAECLLSTGTKLSKGDFVLSSGCFYATGQNASGLYSALRSRPSSIVMQLAEFVSAASVESSPHPLPGFVHLQRSGSHSLYLEPFQELRPDSSVKIMRGAFDIIAINPVGMNVVLLSDIFNDNPEQPANCPLRLSPAGSSDFELHDASSRKITNPKIIYPVIHQIHLN